MKGKKNRTRAVSIGLAVALVVSAVAFGVVSGAPAASAVEWTSARPLLGAAQPTAVKVATEAVVVVQTKPLPKQKTEIVAAPTAFSTSKVTIKRTSSTSSSTSSSSSSSGGTSELAKAQSILAGLIARYPILKGSTVTIGATPNNYQAVCYYKSGRIVVSPTHTTSLTTILNHEAWHIIDWRDNGVIDWGENVPR